MQDRMEKLKKPDLGSMDLRQLQEYGIHNAADLTYRVEVQKRSAQTFGANKIVMIDDVALAVPENQRSKLYGLPGYERAMVPGLIAAAGFEKGATVVVSAPPQPVELDQVRSLRQQLEEKLGRKVDYKVLWSTDGELIDIDSLNPDEYQQRCLDYAKSAAEPGEKPYNSGEYLMQQVSQNISQILEPGDVAHVSPFITTEAHHSQFYDHSQEGRVSLNDTAIQDKAINNYQLRENGFTHIPKLVAVNADGNVIQTSEELIENKTNNQQVENNEANRSRFASGILTVADDFTNRGVQPVIKLDSDGVSGLSNVLPELSPDIFDTSKTHEERTQLISKLLEDLDGGYLPSTAVVEEFIDADKIEGVPKDYTICGQMVDGVFLPLSVTPFGTTNGVYDCEWTAPSAEMLGENPTDWSNMFKVYAQMGELMAENGYRNGILAGDVLTKGENYYVHDYNFRRGGRSTPEAYIAIRPEPVMEAQVEIDRPKMDPETALKVYSRVCESLSDMGVMPFSTAFAYFATNEHKTHLKFKVVVPTENLQNGNGRIPRNDQLQNVTRLIDSLVTQHS